MPCANINESCIAVKKTLQWWLAGLLDKMIYDENVVEICYRESILFLFHSPVHSQWLTW